VGHKASRRVIIKRFCVGYVALMTKRTLWPWSKCIENKCHYVEKWCYCLGSNNIALF